MKARVSQRGLVVSFIQANRLGTLAQESYLPSFASVGGTHSSISPQGTQNRHVFQTLPYAYQATGQDGACAAASVMCTLLLFFSWRRIWKTIDDAMLDTGLFLLKCWCRL